MARKRTSTKQVQATEDKPFTLPQVDVKPEIDDDEPCDPLDGLNIRRRLFVEYITGEACGNATRAASLAGYSDSNVNALKVTACRLLTSPNVQRAIRDRLARTLLTQEKTREAIAAYAESSMDKFLSVDDKGDPKIDWEKAAACGAIAHVREIREEGIGGSDGSVTVIKRTFKIRDPMPALALLAKMHGLVVDQPSASVTVNVQQVNEDDLVRIATRGGDGTATPAPGAAVPDRVR